MSDNLRLGPGRLYFNDPQGSDFFVNAYELETVEEQAPEKPWPKENPFKCMGELTLSLTMVRQSAQRASRALLACTQSFFELCPNKKVKHLAKYAKKERTRKKNRRRAYRLLDKEIRR